MVNNEIAKRLRAIRKENGYTQAKFAEILDISYDGYKKIEKGDTRISIDKLVLIEERFNISAEYIIFGNKPKFDDVWKDVNCLPEHDKFRMMMRLAFYFIKIKKKSLDHEQELGAIDPLMNDFYEKLKDHGILSEDSE